MTTGTIISTCIVIAAVCGLVMRTILKKKAALLETAIATEDFENVTKTSNYGKVPFIIALVVGALAIGTVFALIMAAVFTGGVVFFTG